MIRRAALVGCLALIAPPPARAQETGAVPLAQLVNALGVTGRVLVIAAHPDDEDTRLITFLARGRGVETAYLSLTRGDGGQNLIGPELGEALGLIRTEELLAARRIDGARQYFTRAYDFGYSKSADETFRHWPREELLRDVVTVVRAFRPHVIVAVFSGTANDGHGQHTVSGILAREAYDAAGDSARFPASSTAAFAPWRPLKFYRSANFRGTPTLRYNAGEYDPLLGRSYAEIAGESRSQHKSQAFGVLQRKGLSIGALRLEDSRADAPRDAGAERSPFDGVDTTWERLRGQLRGAPARAALDSVIRSVAALRAGLDLRRPSLAAPAVAAVMRALDALGAAEPAGRASPDVLASLTVARARAERALVAATGIAVEASATRELLASSATDSASVSVTVYNRGGAPLRVLGVQAGAGAGNGGWTTRDTVALLPDSARSWTGFVRAGGRTRPYWLSSPRAADLFAMPPDGVAEDARPLGPEATVVLRVEGQPVVLRVPVVYRVADPVRGDVSRPVAVAPAISVTLDRTMEYAPAGVPITREVRVTLRSAADTARRVRVAIDHPRSLAADSAVRTVEVPARGTRTVTFRLRGRLQPGHHEVRASATAGGERFEDGWTLVDYPHIRPQRMYRPATLTIQAMDVKLAPALTVGYVTGAADNIAPMLEQLGVRVTVLDPARLTATELGRFDAIVVGPRAYESSPDLVAGNSRLLDYARGGGTLVVQYGQAEMLQPGIMPYSITLARPADRVSVEDAPVTILDPAARLMTWPNRITAGAFDGWVQDRSLYMPRTFDARYVPMLEMSDPGEPPNRGALLVARYGRGTYIYTSLAFFRQLPAGVPGPARLFINLLSAGASAPPPRSGAVR